MRRACEAEMKRASEPIEAQAQRVREAYGRTGNANPEYEREAAKLSRMRVQKMADDFRAERGLPPSAPTPYDERSPAPARRLGENEFGLDVGYFDEVVRRDLSNLSDKRPEELARICLRIAETACSAVMAEQEFVSNFAGALRLDEQHLRTDAQVGARLRQLADKAPPGWRVNLAIGEKGWSLTLMTPDQQEQVEATALEPGSAGLRTALTCLLSDLESGACMREYVDRAASQSPEQARAVLWALALQEGGEEEAKKFIAAFADCQAFEDWFDTLEHYDMEDGGHEWSAADRSAMRIAFHQLRSEIDPMGFLAAMAAEQSIGLAQDSVPAGFARRDEPSI